MYKKNLKSATYSNLSILLTVFLNKAVISLLNFFFLFKFKEEVIIIIVINFYIKDFISLFFFFINWLLIQLNCSQSVQLNCS